MSPQEEEQQRRLVQIAREEHGALLVDAIYYPELGQLTAILIGNERVVYDAAGHRVDNTKGDTFRWNGSAWLAALYLVAGIFGLFACIVAMVNSFVSPEGRPAWGWFLFGLFGSVCAISVGYQKARELRRGRGTAPH